mmetsp:Transcript_20335/g.44184  ORF Transcript_20335/g.44184 Transcript_20335/m.44184 type:complete len:382 (-) Transcript_20335:102-1247(-)
MSINEVMRERKRPNSGPLMGRRKGLRITLLVAAALSIPSHAFLTPTPTTPTTPSTRLQMIGNIFGGGSESKEPQLPKDVKDAISKCRGAVQKGLEDRISRMDVEMPVGADYGVENKKSKNKRGNLSSLAKDNEQQEGLTMEKLDTSNRELARLFVEMFQPLGGEHIAAVFNDEYLAEQARQKWSNDISTECNIVAIDRKGKRGIIKTGKKGQKKKAKGFAAKMADEMEEDNSASGPFNLPKDTEVAMFVSPGPKELIAIERICNEGGKGTCVILLNARLSLIEKYASDDARKLFTEEFEPVWSLSAAPQLESPGCLMHRAYPGQWVLARKPMVGPPKTIALKEGGGKFSGDECKEAYSQIEVSELEKGTEKLAENMAGWFK